MANDCLNCAAMRADAELVEKAIIEAHAEVDSVIAAFRRSLRETIKHFASFRLSAIRAGMSKQESQALLADIQGLQQILREVAHRNDR